MADEEEKQEGQAEEKPPKNVMGLVFAIINLVVMCGGAFVVFQQTLGYSPDKSFEKDMIEEVIKEREEKAAESVLYLMPALAINLKGTPKRQLNVEMYLEMLDGDGFEELVNMGAETRDEVMRLLTGKTFGEIESVQGKLFLKEQIATKVNKFLKKGIVKDIFFARFIIE